MNTHLRELSAAELRRRFASARSGRLVLTRLVRAVIAEALAGIEAGREPPIDGNIRTFWYRWLKPIVARIPPEQLGRKDPYRVLVRELAEMVGVERQFDYADFGFVDENWENRRVGAGRPQLIVFAEKSGWIRLLRRVHDRHDVTVLALGGKPSLLTSEYTARHVRESMDRAAITGTVSLLGLVDWDPDGAIVARSFAEQLQTFALQVARTELLVRPEHFDAENLRLFARDIPASARARRWVEDGGGIDGRCAVLSAEAMPAQQVEALVAAWVERLAPRPPVAPAPPQRVRVAAWTGAIGGAGQEDAATVEIGGLARVSSAIDRARAGDVTVLTSRGIAQAAVVPVEVDR